MPPLVPDEPPRDRELPELDRELLPRDFDAPLEPAEEDDDLRVPLDLRAPDLLAPDERLDPVPVDFAREDADFFAPPDEVFEPDEPLLERFAVDRDADDLRAPLDRFEPPLELEDDPALPAPPTKSVGDHLPDMTRCAASATASAISEPNFVALAATLLAACCAVSAASSPASRIFLRAAGLALIAAAAAARPAASISLLIAALASLSTVLLFEVERDDVEPARDEEEREPDDEPLLREELLRADFAIFYLPPCGERHFKAVPVP